MSDVAAFVVLVGVVLVAGVALGMLIVPRLERLSEPPDEEPGDADDPARD